MRYPDDWPEPTGWLARAEQLQRECFVDIGTLPPDEAVAEMRNLVLGLVAEAMEALDEIPDWKWWHEDGGPRRLMVMRLGSEARAKYLEELVDVAHFLGALAVAVGCSDGEWDQVYREKTAVVRARHAERQRLAGETL